MPHETFTEMHQVPVQYDPSLPPSGPGSVKVDSIKLATLLETYGVGKKARNALSVHVGNDPVFTDAEVKNDLHIGLNFGYYDRNTKQIGLNVGSLNFFYTSEVMKAYYTQVGFMDDSTEFNLTTKRLGKYLKAAPKERGIAFAKKLLATRTEKIANEVLIHEAKHMIDDEAQGNVKKLTYKTKEIAEVHGSKITGAVVGVGVFGIIERYIPGSVENAIIGAGVGLYTRAFLERLQRNRHRKRTPKTFDKRKENYLNQDIEIAARTFTEQRKREAAWQSIVSFTPDYKEINQIIVYRK